MATLLVVDDEPHIRSVFATYFTRAGHDVLQAGTGTEAVAIARAERPAVVLLDVFLPDITGFEVLARIRDLPSVVVMITGHGDITAAVNAMQGGAETFLTKPVELVHLGAVVDKALEKAQLREQHSATQARSGRSIADMLLGTSAPMRELSLQIEHLARSESTVSLLVGEHGVGKSRVARAIHALSLRAMRAFQRVNCGAVNEAEMRDMLFGRDALPGALETANGGSLHLRDVEQMPLPVQAELAEVLGAHKVRRANGSREIPLDVRLIASTTCDLATEVNEGRFDERLYYCIGLLPLHLPPLRARSPQDLCDTVAALVAELRHGLPSSPTKIGKDAMKAMLRYPWPGNVRELRNVLERALIHANGAEEVGLVHLSPEVRGLDDDGTHPHSPTTLAQAERVHIERTLRAHRGNRTHAANELDISRATLIKKIREYGLGSRLAVAGNGEEEDE